jgi:hypothetical protein
VIALLVEGDSGRCLVESKDYYGTIDGEDVRLCANQSAAEQMLTELIRKGAPPPRVQRNRPLAEHLDDFTQEMRTRPRGKKKRPPSPEHVSRTVARIRRVIQGCSFRIVGDIELQKVQDFLHGLTALPDAPVIPVGKDEFTKAELAELLGVQHASVKTLVSRAGLEGTGNGKARRFSRATAEALLAKQQTTVKRRGMGEGVAGYYAREMKTFTRWLVRRKRLREDPLLELPSTTTSNDHRRDRRTLDEKELRRMLDAAAASRDIVGGMCGRDRRMLYLVAMSTGSARANWPS